MLSSSLIFDVYHELQVKLTITFMCTIAIVFGNCQGLVEENKTRTVGLQDPNVDATVKTALENGTVSEVVVRKDLLLFPVNAPNLVSFNQRSALFVRKFFPNTSVNFDAMK